MKIKYSYNAKGLGGHINVYNNETLVLSKPWTTLKQREILVIEICKVINKAERNRKDVQLSLRMVV